MVRISVPTLFCHWGKGEPLLPSSRLPALTWKKKTKSRWAHELMFTHNQIHHNRKTNTITMHVAGSNRLDMQHWEGWLTRGDSRVYERVERRPQVVLFENKQRNYDIIDCWSWDLRVISQYEWIVFRNILIVTGHHCQWPHEALTTC